MIKTLVDKDLWKWPTEEQIIAAWHDMEDTIPFIANSTGRLWWARHNSQFPPSPALAEAISGILRLDRALHEQ